MSSELFLAGMRKVAGAVTVVTTIDRAGERRGLTATAICSLSAEPPSLIACVNRKTWVAQFVPDSGVFAVNVLSHTQEAVARAFAGQMSLAAGERFTIGDWGLGTSGVPICRDALASFECRLARAVEHTTHVILIGEVVATALGSGQALVYLGGNFAPVPHALPETM